MKRAKKQAKPKGRARATTRPGAKLGARALAIHERLAVAMPGARIDLDFGDAWQLLIATILSAQSTDKTVNRVTPELFRRYPTPASLARAPQEEVEAVVKPTGFFRNKAKAIREASAAIIERFGGEVPRTLDELVTLPGVARKTANVVLGAAYRVASGVVVDTHAGRVARRLALTKHDDAARVEEDLCRLLPVDVWIDFGTRLVLHGRYVCTAKKPSCGECPINELCPSREAKPVGEWTARAAHERTLTTRQR